MSLAIPTYGGGFVYFINSSLAVYFPSAISPGGTVQAYTPTFTNLTVGNGGLAGIYTQIEKTVYGQIVLTLGSTSSVGNDALVSLPVTGRSNTINTPIGNFMCQDASAGVFNSGVLAMQTTSSMKILIQNAAGTFVQNVGTTAGAPFAWTNGDVLYFNFIYAAA